MKNTSFSLNDSVVGKKTIFLFAEISVFLLKIKKTIRVIIKSLVHAVATLNSNMRISFQVNRIISIRISYNGNFRNMISRKTPFNFPVKNFLHKNIYKYI